MSAAPSTHKKKEDDVPSLPPDFPFIPIGHPDTMMSKESVRRAVEEFQVQPTDIMVATFSKTGTTLVTWLCHLLRLIAKEGIDYDFPAHFEAIETLYQVVPWPLLSWDIGYDPNVDGSQYTPRVFKSHLRMASIYRGCKYIVTIRDPAKTVLSFYNFLLAKQVPLVLELKDVSQFLLETPFVQGRPGRASIWDYYQEYHALRDCPSVLVLVYEDVVQNMPANIRRIATFMGLSIHNNTAIVDKVASMSTKQYMAQYVTLFDEPYERAKQLGRAGDLSQLAPGPKVATQTHTQQLNDTAKTVLQEKWNQSMEPLGYKTYDEFAAYFVQQNQQRWDT
ncbi:Sulfotransferase 1 family member D1 [Seminavis robusta]|uniref:Sulfotransferase 1 family member D1 n=1 Tax=Seminavis robusta TaxID=568900 RepID=A0A9N8ESY6_9STRA|nr:Sulfotransferase 1 family member D1 [Seminavis robusta]|eukprot:Sro1733_g294210.1 Sulfotransferase 1 family member D1 (335) ;mRNA; r:2667-3671